MKKSSLITMLALALLSLLAGCEATEYAAIIATSNDKFHHCYGKVIDQYGQPVAGAQAIATSVFMVSPVASRNEDHFTKTDAQGLFQFTGILGWEVGFGVKKEGYEWDGHGELPDDVQSTPENRDVFVMYKLHGAEPMVHTKIHDYIPCDGTEIQYDLLTGRHVVSAGGLVITFLRNPVDIHRGKPFEWTLTLEVPGGGLVEVHDLYPYEAPENGYQETVTIGTGPDPKNYTDSTTKTYYYKSAGGKYGRLSIDLQADFQPPPTSFDGSIYLNPSGSRNLEWDPAKEIRPAAGGR